jgi:HTH-type transcriptional regulator, cell division transcriptional repressor
LNQQFTTDCAPGEHLYLWLSVIIRFVHRKNIVGPKIRTARKSADMSQEKLAARLQVMGISIDRSAIAKIESGRRPVSDIEIVTIAEILGVEIPWLFGDSRDWFRDQDDRDQLTKTDTIQRTKMPNQS